MQNNTRLAPTRQQANKQYAHYKNNIRKNTNTVLMDSCFVSFSILFFGMEQLVFCSFVAWSMLIWPGPGFRS